MNEGNSKFIGRDHRGDLIFNEYHKDYLICDTCGEKERYDVIDDHFCPKCYTCDNCPHDERKHKRWRRKNG